MKKYRYRPVRFYLITFTCTWLWWLFAILFNEGIGLYIGMFLGMASPAVVAVVTVFTSKSKALINDFKEKLIGFYRIKLKYIIIAVLIFAMIVAASIGISVLFGSSIKQFSFTEDFSFSIGGTSAFLTILLASCVPCPVFQMLWFGVLPCHHAINAHFSHSAASNRKLHGHEG